MNFEEKLKTVKPFAGRKDYADFVPTNGISLNFILENLAQVGGIHTMRDLEAYVVRLTAKNNCSFAELLLAHNKFKEAVTAEADFFISFAYDTSFETVLDALDRHRRKIEAEDISVWISILTINQHFGKREGEHGTIDYPPNWFKQAFEVTISKIQRVLFVLTPIDQPIALERLWCIYELYLAVWLKGCTLDVCLAEEDEQRFMKGLLADTQSILKYINGIDAAKATSSDPVQERKLRERIEKISGQYEVINSEVRDKLRSWFAHAAKNFIEVNGKEYLSKDKHKYIKLIRMVGKMFYEAKKHKEATVLWAEDLKLTKEVYGELHEETATSLNDLAVLLQAEGRLKDAELLQREALKIHRKLVGNADPLVATDLGNLAVLLGNQGNLGEAEDLLREALKINKKAYGEEHPDFAIPLEFLAQNLFNQGKIPEAEKTSKQAVKIGKKVFGDEHPRVATSLYTLGTILKCQGKVVKGEALVKEALRIERKVYGDVHPNIAERLVSIAGSLLLQGKKDEAEAAVKEAVEIDRKLYGDVHPVLANHLYILARMMEVKENNEETKRLDLEARQMKKKCLANE